MNFLTRLNEPMASTTPQSGADTFYSEEQRTDLNTTESHIAIDFEVDDSGSMARDAPALRKSVADMLEALRKMPSVARRVDTQFITAGGTVTKHGPFQSVLQAAPPTFRTSGGTPLGEASLIALDSLIEWEAVLKRHETELVSKILVIISDGEANDANYIDRARAALRDAQESVTVIPFACRGGSRKALEEFCGCRAMDATETDIPLLFSKLTEAIRTVSMISPSQIEGPGFVRNLMFGDGDA